MDPKLLFQLAEVVQSGSLTKAAEQLRVTQPTLTRNMKIIEGIVGTPVLRRGRYGVVPTEMGLRLAAEGHAIGSRMQQADEFVEQWRAGLDGELRVGVGPMLAPSIMPPLLAKIVADPPSFVLRVLSASAVRLIDWLNDGQLDIVVAAAQPHLHNETLAQEEILDDRLAVFAGPKSPLAMRRNKLTLADLKGHKWIGSGAISQLFGPYREVLGDLDLGGVGPVVDVTGDIFITLELLRTSDVLAILPRRLMSVIPQTEDIVCLDVDATLPARNVAIWLPRTKLDRPEIAHFVDRLKDHVSQLGLSTSTVKRN